MRIPILLVTVVALGGLQGQQGGGHHQGPGPHMQHHGQMHHGGGECDGRCPHMGALPEEMASQGRVLSPARVDLGRMLYYEPRLSKSKAVSCNTCHPLDKYGVDGGKVSLGHEGLKGARNAPTVYNAAGHFVQFWDGRAADVEEQAKGPVMNPVEMAMPSAAEVEGVLRAMPGYQQAFRKAFPGESNPVTFDNMAIAIGAFERKLVTPSRWDRYLKGDDSALSAAEKAGWATFRTAGCQTCHMGPYVGGSVYRKLGEAQAFPNTADAGRYEVTRREADRMMFKVPSLRNVAKTGPYFHNGEVAQLQEAVRLMGRHQLGQELSTAQVASIATFLNALTGEIPREYIKQPKLPEAR